MIDARFKELITLYNLTVIQEEDQHYILDGASIKTATGAFKMLKLDAEKLEFKIKACEQKVVEKYRGKTFENEIQKESN